MKQIRTPGTEELGVVIEAGAWEMAGADFLWFVEVPVAIHTLVEDEVHPTMIGGYT